MITVAIREVLVVLLGAGISLSLAVFANAGQDFAALSAAVLVPIGLCLARAALVPPPAKHLGPARQYGYQALVALGLVSLLLFEMGMGLIAGAQNIPVSAWCVVVSFAIAYVALFCSAHWTGFPSRA